MWPTERTPLPPTCSVMRSAHPYLRQRSEVGVERIQISISRYLNVDTLK